MITTIPQVHLGPRPDPLRTSRSSDTAQLPYPGYPRDQWRNPDPSSLTTYYYSLSLSLSDRESSPRAMTTPCRPHAAHTALIGIGSPNLITSFHECRPPPSHSPAQISYSGDALSLATEHHLQLRHRRHLACEENAVPLCVAGVLHPRPIDVPVPEPLIRHDVLSV